MIIDEASLSCVEKLKSSSREGVRVVHFGLAVLIIIFVMS